MTRILICVTGMPGSGKSIVAAVSKELGIPIVNMGDVVREETLRRYGMITPELLRETSIALRKEYGPKVIAERVLMRIKNIDKKIVVIDGVRSLYEIEVFKNIGNPVILAIHASPKTRYERIRQRGRPGDPDNWEDFVKRDMIELGFGIGNVIALADYMVVNEGAIEETYKRVREILEGLQRNVCESRG
ncbi:MAG: flagellar hook-basal body complex protein FliE [Desulfurococcales archaeon]|nr:flagellar hook-basal body complex protein FliE [Desulfurococcales archaeon]